MIYSKRIVQKHIKNITKGNLSISQYAKDNGLQRETFYRAIRKYAIEWWNEHTDSDLPEKTCYCGIIFKPSNKNQIYHHPSCSAAHKRDQEYFGGKRNNTIGWVDQTCQVCSRKVSHGLSSHHLFGKMHDTNNEHLYAVCTGCHQAISLLANRNFLDEEEGWEKLIWFVWMRRNGYRKDRIKSLNISVEVEDDISR